MKKLTPAMLQKALGYLHGFTKKAKPYLKDKERLNYLLTEALRLGRSRGGKLLKDVDVLVRLLKAWRSGEYAGIATRDLLTMVAAIIYLISPFDLIPDFVPVAGYIDDAAVIAWLFESLGDELAQFRKWEKQSGSGFGGVRS